MNPYEFDLAQEEVFPLAELPEHIKHTRKGKKLHRSAGYRFSKGRLARDGSLVALPVVKVGGGLCTSLGAFSWFCNKLSDGGGTPSAAQKNVARTRSAERAARELDAIGI